MCGEFCLTRTSESLTGGLASLIDPSPMACCRLTIKEFSSGARLLPLGQVTLIKKEVPSP